MHCACLVALLLLLSRFSHVRLCAAPQTAAHQAPLSLGFSRQEQWSGLPLPSPVHACMLSRFSRVHLGFSLGKNAGVGCHFLLHLVAQLCPIHCHPIDCWQESFRQECWSRMPRPPPGDLPDPRMEPRSPALQADALPSEPAGKPSIYTLLHIT